MVVRRFFPLLLICGALLLASGCSNGDTYSRLMVNGTVNLDGEPLATGSITFFPETEGAVATGGKIENGEFVIAKDQGLPAGSYKVSITSTISTPSIPNGPDNPIDNPPIVKSLVPKQYNSETTLKAEVHDAADNFLAFDLSSK